MKNLKTYENKQHNGSYWTIYTRAPYFEASLFYIGMPYKIIPQYINDRSLTIGYFYVYIARDDKADTWDWYEIDDRIKNKLERKFKLQNKGTIELRDKPLKDILNDIEIYKNANKYNV